MAAAQRKLSKKESIAAAGSLVENAAVSACEAGRMGGGERKTERRRRKDEGKERLKH